MATSSHRRVAQVAVAAVRDGVAVEWDVRSVMPPTRIELVHTV
jgi:hypothetical protein